jgi:Uma2 family endonuclease
MLTVEKKKKYTVDDYLMLEEGAPFQLINNDLIMSPSPLLIHQLILGEFYDSLKTFIKQSKDKGMVVLPPMDIRLDDGNVYQPDLIYISQNRIAEIAKDRIEGAPDLVLEILSPSTAYYDLRQKKDTCEKYGIKEYIIIDPIVQIAELYALKDSVYFLHQKAEKKDKLNSLILPGFTVDLSEIFKY